MKDAMDVLGKLEAQTQKLPDDDDENTNTIFMNPKKPIILKFEDVVYKVKTPKEGFFRRNRNSPEEKVILNGVTGKVAPGEMLAMLGPSGSGKTTLLTALGGRLSGGRLSGQISYNNKPFSNALKRNVGFVTQDDVMYAHLTVTETLVFTALLRLPENYTKEAKIAQAEAVISQLGLQKCRDSIIGGKSRRGVSGGERKRVSIGQEMLINPSLLFLDEPTSGLDSTTAQRIVRKLWELADQGRKTIVMTIHQPSSRLFYMFHKVMLLSEGKALYFGEGGQVMQYFASIEFAPAMAMNPADFLLDLANGVAPDGSDMDRRTVKEALVSAYQNHLADRLKQEIHEEEDNNYNNVKNTAEDKHFGDWSTTWWEQFTILLKRGVKERKHESFSGVKIAQVLMVSLIIGLLWWQCDDAHLQDKIGMFFFYAAFWGFFPLFQAIFTFPEERQMLEKERSSGMYRLSSYFISRIIGDLPMELVLPTGFVIITYFMTGLKLTVGHFFQTLFVLLYSVLVAQGLGLAIGALIMDQKAATTFASVIMMAFLLAGGYYVQNVPPFISWIKYISTSHYTYKLLLGSQYKPNDTYPCSGPNGPRECLVGEFPPIKQIGLDGQVVATIALGVMLVGYRFIAYIALMRIGVTKIKT